MWTIKRDVSLGEKYSREGEESVRVGGCLLYTSDAADEVDVV